MPAILVITATTKQVDTPDGQPPKTETQLQLTWSDGVTQDQVILWLKDMVNSMRLHAGQPALVVPDAEMTQRLTRGK